MTSSDLTYMYILSCVHASPLTQNIPKTVEIWAEYFFGYSQIQRGSNLVVLFIVWLDLYI